MSSSLVETITRHGNSSSNDDGEATPRPALPVLIIPGFMSSGMELQESTIREAWQGKRLWINLRSLGFEAIRLGRERVIGLSSDSSSSEKEEDNGENNEEEEEVKEQRHKEYKSYWLQHFALDEDMISERQGVKVRNIESLAGVDYLSPGSLVSFVSYVFGPVIKALVKVGYEKGKNLDAAPYDWRLPPKVLEERDGFFTRTVERVERMYEDNNKTPIVLMCHSLGGKAGHYLLNFVMQEKGQAWLDKYIHTYMPVGAPHIGAPSALTSGIVGSKMGLGAFLTDDEALALLRSFGCGPWMLPKELPETAGICNAYVARLGQLSVRLVDELDVGPLFDDRALSHRPKSMKATVLFGGTILSSSFVRITENNTVCFEDDSFVFATRGIHPSNKYCSKRLAVFLCEPGIG